MNSPSLRDELPAIIETLAAGLVGGGLFHLAGLPAPWLSGPMITIAFLIACGRRPNLPDWLRDLGMMLAGIVMGSAINPAMLQALGRYPVSLAMLMLTTIGVVVFGRLALIKLFRWDGDTALFGALPGAMSAVLATAASAQVDMQKIITVQAFRMFVLVALLPSVVITATVTLRPLASGIIDARGFALVMGGAYLASVLFDRWGVFAPYLFGGMVASGVPQSTGLLFGAPPDFIANLSMFLIGVFAGSRLAGISAQSIGRLIMPALVLFAVSVGVAFLGALLTTLVANTPLAEALVAFAPGGLEAMVVLGMAMGLDPLYVSSHHVARFVLISAGLPLVARWIIRSGP